MENSGQEKTEQPTAKKLDDAKKEGQVARSMEIPTAFILLFALGTLMFYGPWMTDRLEKIMTWIFRDLHTFNFTETYAQTFLAEIFFQLFIVLMPFMLIILIAGVAANIIQVGFIFSGKPLIPKLDKLDPINGVKKLVSLKSLVELIKSMLKIVFIGTIAYLTVKSDIESVPSLIQMSVADIMAFTGWVSMKIIFFVCLAMIVLATIDFVYQKWQFNKDMMMSIEEVKEETKQTEGDPRVKSQIRRVQREMARKRMMDKIPEADVVITNPTHIAIALEFKPEEMSAPRVIAKGADYIALKIKEIAKNNNVPIVENKPLARTLFKISEIGEYIPVELYKTIAEVLAYVYRLKGKKLKPL